MRGRRELRPGDKGKPGGGNQLAGDELTHRASAPASPQTPDPHQRKQADEKEYP